MFNVTAMSWLDSVDRLYIDKDDDDDDDDLHQFSNVIVSWLNKSRQRNVYSSIPRFPDAAVDNGGDSIPIE